MTKAVCSRQCKKLFSKLEGKWEGDGFFTIFLPKSTYDSTEKFGDKKSFIFKAARTKEVFEFKKLEGPIINRGIQKDICISGVEYKQLVFDEETSKQLHLENGMFTIEPSEQDGKCILSRKATIAHGNAFLTENTFFSKCRGPPKIDDMDITPKEPSNIEEKKSSLDKTACTLDSVSEYLKPMMNVELPRETTIKDIINPNRLLKRAIKGQNITSTITFTSSTNPNGGIVNSSFIKKNSDTTNVDATFWVSRVKDEKGKKYLQLQYTQTIVLEFDDIEWMHVTVGTLRKI